MAVPRVSARSERLPRRALALICATALAVRAVIGFWAAGRGEMEGLSWRYHQDALAMVAGYGISRPIETAPPQVRFIALAESLAARGVRLSPAHVPAKDPTRWRPSSLHPPGYAIYLALVYRLFGEPLFFWARAIQALLDALACVLVFRLGRRFVGVRAGLVAAWGYALFLPVAYLATSRVADSLIPALVIATFALLVRALDGASFKWYAASGAVLGLTCLLRPDMLLLPGFLLIVAASRAQARVRAVVGVALLGVTAFAMLIPWGVRNLRELGSFQIASLAGGMSLYQSVGQFPNPYGIVFDDGASADSARRAGFESVDDPGADRYFKRRFAAIVQENPGLLAGQALRRIPLGLAPLYHWGYDNPAYRGHGFYDYVNRDRISAYRAVFDHPLELFLAYWDRLLFGALGLLLLVAGVALIVVERERWSTALLLQIPYLYLFLSHLPIVLGARLLIPGVFGQLIILGYWVQRLSTREPVHLKGI